MEDNISSSSSRAHTHTAMSSSPVSYAFSLPDPHKYRSRFLPMRWPDLVSDDWAFRRWRSEGKNIVSVVGGEEEVFV